MLVKDIAARYGVSTVTVYELLKRYNIPRDRNLGNVACRIIREHQEWFKDDPDSYSKEFLQEMLGVKCDEQ